MRYGIHIFFFVMLSLKAFSQETTIYLDKNFRKLSGKEGAEYYTTIQLNDKTKLVENETTYYITGEKYRTSETKTIEADKNGGKYVHLMQKWYKNGQLYYSIPYTKGKKEGEALGYYPDGKLKRREYYVNGQLEKGECFNQDGTSVDYFPHEVQPVFPGGEQIMVLFIKKNLKYTTDALREGKQGLVVVQFTVDEKGRIFNPEVVKKLFPSLDAEAIRVVQLMSYFEPAMEEGVAKAFTYTLPIRFNLNIRNNQTTPPGFNNPSNSGFGGGPYIRF